MNTEEAQILVANTSAVFSDGGRNYRIIKGRTTARRGARIIRGREHLWTPLVVDYDLPVTEEPPKRKRGRPRKSEAIILTSEDKPEEQPEEQPEEKPEENSEEKEEESSKPLSTKDVPIG